MSGWPFCSSQNVEDAIGVFNKDYLIFLYIKETGLGIPRKQQTKKIVSSLCQNLGGVGLQICSQSLQNNVADTSLPSQS